MISNREILGKGFKFPFRIGGDSLSHDGPEQSKYELHVLDCLKLLLLTRYKSRRYQRHLGNRIFEMPFDDLVTLSGLAKELVKDSLDQEPRIEFGTVSSTVDHVKNKLTIHVDVTFLATSKRANLVFPFYKTDEGRPSIKEVQIEF